VSKAKENEIVNQAKKKKEKDNRLFDSKRTENCTQAKLKTKKYPKLKKTTTIQTRKTTKKRQKTQIYTNYLETTSTTTKVKKVLNKHSFFWLIKMYNSR